MTTLPATTHETDTLETVRRAVGDAGAGKVFGEPIYQDGLTVLPVAKVTGGGGGGGGQGPAETGQDTHGSGGGFGLSARPLGVFVIKDGSVSWRPAVDVNKVVLGGQLVALTALLVLRAIVKARTRSKRA
ncbi:MAG TPA: spore germination protein GerW family protein [Micromonosporaceae bacterium]|nr:spore germination protein GerW family protein [Micromonosporaceae bacterium]